MDDPVARSGLDAGAVARRLAAAGCVAADAEAAELAAAAARASGAGDVDVPEAWVRRRESGEPLAWITGGVTFAGRRLVAGPGVYVPRPQTEELARRAAAHLPAGGRAVDLCTGLGAVAATLASMVPDAYVAGVDLDEGAARLARRNGVAVVVGDLAEALAAHGQVDVVTAVAPYVPSAALALLPSDVRDHEPHRALDGGEDGLVLVRRVVAGASRLLRPGGWLVIEVGGEQDQILAPDLAAGGFDRVERWSDDEGDVRGIEARLGRAGSLRAPAGPPTMGR